jgi:TonB family protein
MILCVGTAAPAFQGSAPFSYEIAMTRGEQYLIKGDYPSAAECFRRALTHEPSDWRTRFFLAKTYEAIGVMDHAWYYSNSAFHLAETEQAKDTVLSWIARVRLYLTGVPPDSIRQFDAWAIAWPESMLVRRTSRPAQQGGSESTSLLGREVVHGDEHDVPPPPHPEQFHQLPQAPPRPSMPGIVRYPELAREEGVEGTVILIAVVDQTSRVVDAWVQKGNYPILNDAALEAVYAMRFTPVQVAARGQHKLLRARVSVPFSFPP